MDYLINQIRRVYSMSNTTLRQYLYKDKINYLQQLDKAVSERLFGEGTVIRIVGDCNLLEKDQIATKLLRAIDIYTYIRDNGSNDLNIRLNKISELSCNPTRLCSEDGSKMYKDLIKDWKSNLDLKISDELLYSFLLSLKIVPSGQIRNFLMENYLSKYERDERNTDDNLFFRQHDSLFFEEYANYVSRSEIQIPNDVIPACKEAYSSLQRKKKYDQGTLGYYLMENESMNKYAKEFLLNCLRATKAFYACVKDDHELDDLINKVDRLVPTDGPEGIQFLPRLEFVSQDKGKLGRPIFAGNDFSDIALYPFMTLIKSMMKGDSCNMSLGNRYGTSMLSKVSRVRKRVLKGVKIGSIKVNNKRQPFKYQGSMASIDSSSATEKISCQYMKRLFLETWQRTPQEWRKITNISEEYLGYAFELLTSTPYYFEHYGSIGYSFSYGTSQGLMGSWDLLHYTTMITIGLSYHDDIMYSGGSPEMSVRAMIQCSLVNGDDGAYHASIDKIVKTRLQNNSLPDVVSKDKSASEDEMGFLAFSSAYPTSGMPRLSNIRILSLVVALSMPDSLIPYYTDIWTIRQINASITILNNFVDKYNIGDVVVIKNLDFMIRANRWHYLNAIIKRYIFSKPQFAIIKSIKPGTSLSLVTAFTPSIRCRNVIVNNNAIDQLQLEMLITGVALEQCHEVDTTEYYVLDILSESRDAYIREGIIPSIPGYDHMIKSILNGFGSPAKVSDMNILPPTEVYNLIYRGYKSNNQIINVKFSITGGS